MNEAEVKTALADAWASGEEVRVVDEKGAATGTVGTLREDLVELGSERTIVWLNEITEITPVPKPDKPSILDEEWALGVPRADGTERIINKSGHCIGAIFGRERADAVAALPDMARVLVKLRKRFSTGKNLAFNAKDIAEVRDALKKAGLGGE